MDNDNGFVPGFCVGLIIGIVFALWLGVQVRNEWRKDCVQSGYAHWKTLSDGKTEFIFHEKKPASSEAHTPTKEGSGGM